MGFPITQDPKQAVYYSPNIRGFDTSFWNKLAGTVAASGSVPNKVIRLTNGDITSFSQYRYGRFDFALNIPNTPSGAESRVWGLRWSETDRGAMYFEISGSTFQVVSRNDAGTATTTAITFTSAWAGSEIVYSILWTPTSVSFIVNDIHQKTHSASENHNIPTMPVPLRVDTNEADNVDVGYISVNDAGRIT